MITGFLVAINRSPLVSCWSFTPCQQPANRWSARWRRRNQSQERSMQRRAPPDRPTKKIPTGEQQGKTRPFFNWRSIYQKFYPKFSGQKVVYQHPPPLRLPLSWYVWKIQIQKNVGIRQGVSFTLATTPLQPSVGPLNKWLGVGLFSYDCFGNDATCSHTIKAK